MLRLRELGKHLSCFKIRIRGLLEKNGLRLSDIHLKENSYWLINFYAMTFRGKDNFNFGTSIVRNFMIFTVKIMCQDEPRRLP